MVGAAADLVLAFHCRFCFAEHGARIVKHRWGVTVS